MKQRFLGIEQQKGSSDHLKGRLIAYALVPQIPAGSSKAGGLPFEEIIQNGIFAVVGDYTKDKSLKEFIENLKSSHDLEDQEDYGSGENYGSNVDFGPSEASSDDSSSALEGLLQDLGGELPDNLSEDEILDKLEELTHVEVIPVPARIGHFESVDEILDEDADVFFLGEFQNPHNAQLSTTTFPILYQSAFKEQQANQVNSQIDQILSHAEHQQDSHEAPREAQTEEIESVKETFMNSSYKKFKGDLAQYLFNSFIPVLLHKSSHTENQLHLFRRFMEDYPFPEDLDRFESIAPSVMSGNSAVQREIELLCQKFSALREEEFEKLEGIQQELSQYRK